VWQPEGCYRELQLRLSQKGPMSPAERAKLAEADYRLGYYPAARQEAARALRSNAEHGWSTYWLSHSYSQLATQAFLKVTSLNPNSARVHELLAQYYANHFDFAHAKSEYAAALRIEPELPDLHLGLGSIHWALGEWSDAERELRTTLQLSPGSTTARYELGDSLVKQNRWQDALDPLREAAADPKFAVKARMDLAVAEEQSGRVAQAISDLEPAAEDDPTGDVHFLLARLYRKAGDAASARKAQLEFLRLRNAGNASQRAELEALDKR
jgi:Tfp pilus assembly protein PilF